MLAARFVFIVTLFLAASLATEGGVAWGDTVSSSLTQIIDSQHGPVVVTWLDSGPSVNHVRIVEVVQYHGDSFRCKRIGVSGHEPRVGEMVPTEVSSTQLPPGLVDALPRFEGYAWRRVGHDLVLIAISSNSYHNVFHDLICPSDSRPGLEGSGQ
ncbi:hypothetical protein [Kushneria aurantia]|uniref:Uncharacterized protein n=1 Tax=Kushneria aurantia TaxID=504092 RepID=A0ABV6FYI2_9GAMM|nr:hypothetical protein [Kushneria aurantia]